MGESNRRVLTKAVWPTSAFFSATEDIRNGTVWQIERPADTVVIHLGGPITHLETELKGCGAVFDPPMPGEVWVIPAHSRYVSAARGGVVHYAELQLDPVAANRLAGKPVVRRPVQPRAGHFDNFLYRAVLRLESLTRQQDDLARMASQSLGQALLFDFYDRYAERGPLPVHPRHVRLTASERGRVQQFVQDNIGAPLRLETLAALVGMTVHEFLIAFRAAFNASPAQYVIEQRLRRARWLLRHSARPIATIALETGFSSHAHLTSVFRARLDITPREFRQNQAGP